MKPLRMYAIGRLLFGVAALAAPALSGRTLAGPGGELPDAQAFLRGMGGREIGLGLGLLAAIRSGGPVRPWLLAGVLSDGGDLAGIAGAWTHLPVSKGWLGLTTAGAAASTGAILLAGAPRQTV
ncbi:hypothetical protein [Mycobacterium sp. MMS18-G62]